MDHIYSEVSEQPDLCQGEAVEPGKWWYFSVKWLKSTMLTAVWH